MDSGGWLLGTVTNLGIAWAIGMSGAVISLMVKVGRVQMKLDDLITFVKNGKNGGH